MLHALNCRFLHLGLNRPIPRTDVCKKIIDLGKVCFQDAGRNGILLAKTKHRCLKKTPLLFE